MRAERSLIRGSLAMIITSTHEITVSTVVWEYRCQQLLQPQHHLHLHQDIIIGMEAGMVEEEGEVGEEVVVVEGKVQESPQLLLLLQQQRQQLLQDDHVVVADGKEIGMMVEGVVMEAGKTTGIVGVRSVTPLRL